MFIPNYFKNEDLEEVRDFMKKNSFGILITTNNNKIWGSHIPLELEKDLNGEEVIYGHIAKANFQWKDFKENDNVLLIFNGPHAYVSSSWYGHENVPTWNYIAVHVYGQLKVIEEEELRYSLKKLLDKYEAHMKSPIHMEDLSEKTMRQIKGVVGFKVLISEIQAAYKLSQNRNNEDYHRIIGELKKTDQLGKGVSEVMENKK